MNVLRWCDCDNNVATGIANEWLLNPIMRIRWAYCVNEPLLSGQYRSTLSLSDACVRVQHCRLHKLTHFSKNIIAILFSFRNICVSLSQYLLDEYSGVIRDCFSIAEYLSDICCWLVTCSTWNKTNYNVSTRFTNSKSSQVKIDLINLRWVSLTTIGVYLKYSALMGSRYATFVHGKQWRFL